MVGNYAANVDDQPTLALPHASQNHLGELRTLAWAEHAQRRVPGLEVTSVWHAHAGLAVQPVQVSLCAHPHHGGHEAIDGNKVNNELWGLLLKVFRHTVDGTQPRIVYQDANLVGSGESRRTLG